jgi:hypothetical protein
MASAYLPAWRAPGRMRCWRPSPCMETLIYLICLVLAVHMGRGHNISMMPENDIPAWRTESSRHRRRCH